MNEFKIGTRVKKMRGGTNIGLTGVVVGLDHVAPGQDHPMLEPMKCILCASDIQIRFDTAWVPKNDTKPMPPGSIGFGVAHEYEPIIPEGMKPSEFTSMEDLKEALKKAYEQTH